MKKIEITDEKDKAPTDLKIGDRLKISTTSLTLQPGVAVSLCDSVKLLLFIADFLLLTRLITATLLFARVSPLAMHRRFRASPSFSFLFLLFPY